jgi:acetamidase/formamidase
MPFGVFSGRGWLFLFVFRKDKNRMKRSGPPSDVGVNLLVRGAILAFPVHARGGLPYVGDRHATQGDGELPGVTNDRRATATLQVNVVEGRTFASPGLETGNDLMTTGKVWPLEDTPRIACREPVRGMNAGYDFGSMRQR